MTPALPHVPVAVRVLIITGMVTDAVAVRSDVVAAGATGARVRCGGITVAEQAVYAAGTVVAERARYGAATVEAEHVNAGRVARVVTTVPAAGGYPVAAPAAAISGLRPGGGESAGGHTVPGELADVDDDAPVSDAVAESTTGGDARVVRTTATVTGSNAAVLAVVVPAVVVPVKAALDEVLLVEIVPVEVVPVTVGTVVVRTVAVAAFGTVAGSALSAVAMGAGGGAVVDGRASAVGDRRRAAITSPVQSRPLMVFAGPSPVTERPASSVAFAVGIVGIVGGVVVVVVSTVFAGRADVDGGVVGGGTVGRGTPVDGRGHGDGVTPPARVGTAGSAGMWATDLGVVGQGAVLNGRRRPRGTMVVACGGSADAVQVINFSAGCGSVGRAVDVHVPVNSSGVTARWPAHTAANKVARRRGGAITTAGRTGTARVLRRSVVGAGHAGATVAGYAGITTVAGYAGITTAGARAGHVGATVAGYAGIAAPGHAGVAVVSNAGVVTGTGHVGIMAGGHAGVAVMSHAGVGPGNGACGTGWVGSPAAVAGGESAGGVMPGLAGGVVVWATRTGGGAGANLRRGLGRCPAVQGSEVGPRGRHPRRFFQRS